VLTGSGRQPHIEQRHPDEIKCTVTVIPGANGEICLGAEPHHDCSSRGKAR
jgi:hypothetical protein